MTWLPLTSPEQLEAIKAAPGYSLIFKHSTRCIISKMALKSLEADWKEEQAPVSAYYLDLLNYKELSAQIAEMFHVYHESPQILLIRQGECLLDASHNDISFHEIMEVLATQEN